MPITPIQSSPQPVRTSSNPVRWKPDRRLSEAGWSGAPPPKLLTALRRGIAGRCPVCGEGKIFAGFLSVAPECLACGAPLGEIRADDLPPYITVFIVAHVVIGAQIMLERMAELSVTTELMMFLPGTLALTLALMRPVKGATVGLMMKLGFMKPADEPNA